MGRTWVLRTDTKGTGAQMVPLESTTQHPTPVEPVFVPREPVRRREPEPTEPAPPRTFRVVDVMTRQSLVDGGSARETLDALKDVRSIVDVTVYAWQHDSERWQRLTFGEVRAMWELARA